MANSDTFYYLSRSNLNSSINNLNEKIGFDKTRFLNKEDVDEFICIICHGVFNTPLVSQCCNQTYCSHCINNWLNNANTCPNCRATLNKSGLNEASRSFKNLLAKLKMSCEYHSEGCLEQISLSDMDNHIKNCEFKPNIKCKKCGLIREKLSTHDCVESLLKEMNKVKHEKDKMKREYESKLTKERQIFKSTIDEYKNLRVKLSKDMEKIEKNGESKLASFSRPIFFDSKPQFGRSYTSASAFGFIPSSEPTFVLNSNTANISAQPNAAINFSETFARSNQGSLFGNNN